MDDATKAMALEIGERIARDANKGSRYILSAEDVGKTAAQIINAMDDVLNKGEDSDS